MADVSHSVFDVSRLHATKADPALIAVDQMHFAAIEDALNETIEGVNEHLDAQRRATGGDAEGQDALDRDQEVHRLTARLRTLTRFGVEACLGRMVATDGTEPVYVGRLGLRATDGRRLLTDWRSPAAAPFFAATYLDPMGLTSRRRYRWTDGRVTDFWDEVFEADGRRPDAAPDAESAFIASLGASRSSQMRDVLATLASDQDAIIRAPSEGALVVDGGPGTGKTVVALHRAAYLMYSDPRMGQGRGGLLFIGPHHPYLSYVADVLPSLGEYGVQTSTLNDLVAEGAAAAPEPDPRVARLKSDGQMVQAIEAAVGMYEEPPTAPIRVSTEWGDAVIRAADWAEAFDAVAPGTVHNDAPDQILEQLVEMLLAHFGGEIDGDDETAVEGLRITLERDRELRVALGRAWPLLEATDIVGDLWSVPAYLRMAAPWLAADEVEALQRRDPQAWTVADLPLLDAARLRLGDPNASRQRRRRAAAVAAREREMSDVAADLIASDDSEMLVMSMLRGSDMQSALVDPEVLSEPNPDRLAGPFAHVIVDEAQELTDVQWQMLRRRCPSGSFTIVGDRAQARHGFTETWDQRLERVGLHRIHQSSLHINYRTPTEVMAEAEPVIRSAIPDANVPVSVRSTGIAVTHAATGDLDSIVQTWLTENDEGIGCVIGDPNFVEVPRVSGLTPELAKGLEFDLVVLVDPDDFGEGIEGTVDRYVAMTRATQRLVVLTSR